MKKWTIVVLTGLITAGSVSAALWPFGSEEKTDDAPAVVNPQDASEQMQRKHPPGGPDGMQRKRLQISEKQRAQMKKNHQQMQKLVEAIRTETDPVKKAELTDQLRTKLTEGAEKMHAAFSKRLEQAEGDVAKMKQRLADEVKNKDQKVEEMLQRLLSGEEMRRPEGKGPGEGQRRRTPPTAE